MSGNLNPKSPVFRKLRGYAFDPSLSLKMETATINEIVYKVPWEKSIAENRSAPPDKCFSEGPCGEYVEIVDYDPSVDKFYAPVNLNDPYILAQDGLAPSESNPQFHQQMVYAVAMTTIKNFEMALGRQIMWSPHTWIEEPAQNPQTTKNTKTGATAVPDIVHYDFVPRLRIYPHAFRDANAYYSPQKKALLFGYFSSQPAEITLQMPNSIVFTCLSHDIIAHETTHAILDGMYRRYTEATNLDMLAFHEGFADIVALFQHFTFPDVLKSQIAKTRGDLAAQNLLGQLAQEFGTAIGSYGALRDAIGYIDEETKQWKAREPNGNEYQTVLEPHARGAILVAAVFDAFITIYKSRISDLLRIASGGSGILPHGELQSDLVNRLAMEASKTAGHVLRMCIRALDYCPPIDLTFGDYLRGIITADADIVEDDTLDYRIAFIDAFRKRGIYPAGIRNLSVESLCYPNPSERDILNIQPQISVLTEFLRDFHKATIYVTDRQQLFNVTGDYISGKSEVARKILGLHNRINIKFLDSPQFQLLTGLVFNGSWPSLGIRTSSAHSMSMPAFEVHSLKVASRVGPNGNKVNQIVMTLIQRCGVESITKDTSGVSKVTTFVPGEGSRLAGDQFIMTGGCTLIFDLDTLTLKYAISKPLLNVSLLKEQGKYEIDAQRASKVMNSLGGKEEQSMYQAYFSLGKKHASSEPFSFLHQH